VSIVVVYQGSPVLAVDLGTEGLPPQPDGRLNAPAFHRNRAPIWAVLTRFLDGRTGDVLELGSGTGQHAIAFAEQIPGLVWWPSDAGEEQFRSIEAWRAHANLPNVRAGRRIDLMDANWTPGAGAPAQFAMILCINVVHISPWRVSENLFTGSARHLGPDGRLYLYGPFMRAGRHTAPSNAAFDVSLRRQNPAWGVRDVDDLARLAREAGLRLADISEMPANNLTLSFAKS
jgi:SAM-dependent methyltransferase